MKAFICLKITHKKHQTDTRPLLLFHIWESFERAYQALISYLIYNVAFDVITIKMFKEISNIKMLPAIILATSNILFGKKYRKPPIPSFLCPTTETIKGFSCKFYLPNTSLSLDFCCHVPSENLSIDKILCKKQFFNLNFFFLVSTLRTTFLTFMVNPS